MEVHTHHAIDRRLVGVPEALGEGTATASLPTLPEMAADARGLVHGGFVFGLADYAAMLAVNDPNVVLGAAEARFLAPVVVGEVVRAVATRTGVERRKHTVEVVATVGEREVFRGTFTTFVLEAHVLDGRSR
jgi:acyl-coenzyme A thioesterase PaaI-like protein